MQSSGVERPASLHLLSALWSGAAHLGRENRGGGAPHRASALGDGLVQPFRFQIDPSFLLLHLELVPARRRGKRQSHAESPERTQAFDSSRHNLKRACQLMRISIY